jgi:hypothetical protein
MANCNLCFTNNCGNVIITSQTPQIEITIPYIITKQGNREFGSGSISTDDLLLVADIPALNFSKSNDQFCKTTIDYVNQMQIGIKPSLWQRPADMGRINSAVRWLSEPTNNSMPDGILIGQRFAEAVGFQATPHSIVGNFEIYQLKIVNNLEMDCPSCGPYLDEDGQQIYRNRCPNHQCVHHYETTSPFAIIDGQHRTLSLFNSSLNNKQVNVSILLRNAIKPNLMGYNPDEQAKIFTQVNTKSEELTKLHKTWLRRFFGDWSSTPSDAVFAFDLLGNLGQTVNPGVQNRWSPFVKFHPKGGRARIDSERATEAGTGTIGGLSSMESIIPAVTTAASISNRTPYLIMTDFLESAALNFPDQISLPVGVGFLDNVRPFEAFLRNFPRIVNCVQAMPGFSGQFTVADFTLAFSQYSTILNSVEWELYSKSGELPWMEFYNILKLMWNPNANGQLPQGPNWQTNSGNPNLTWVDYIQQTPDPLEDYSDTSKCDQNSIVISNGPLNPTFDRQLKFPTDQITWLRPRNSASAPKLYYRIYSQNGTPGPWLNNDSGLQADPVTSDNRQTLLNLDKLRALETALINSASVLWDLRVVYYNLIGESTTIINYKTQ